MYGKRFVVPLADWRLCVRKAAYGAALVAKKMRKQASKEAPGRPLAFVYHELPCGPKVVNLKFSKDLATIDISVIELMRCGPIQQET